MDLLRVSLQPAPRRLSRAAAGGGGRRAVVLTAQPQQLDEQQQQQQQQQQQPRRQGLGATPGEQRLQTRDAVPGTARSRQRAASPRPAGRRPTPAQVLLDKEIWRAGDAATLAAIITDRVADFSAVHTANAATRLAALVRRAPPAERRAALAHPSLPALLAAAARMAPAAGSRDAVALLQAFAWLRLDPPPTTLAALGARLAQLVPSTPPVDVAYAAWALAKLGHSSPELWGAVEAALAAPGDGWLARLPPGSLVSLLWSCARTEAASPALVSGIAGELRAAAAAGRRLPLEAGQVSVALYSFARLRYNPGEEVRVPPAGLAALMRSGAKQHLVALCLFNKAHFSFRPAGGGAAGGRGGAAAGCFHCAGPQQHGLGAGQVGLAGGPGAGGAGRGAGRRGCHSGR